MKVVFAFLLVTACAGQSTEAKKAEAEATYGAELDKCAATQPTREASRACRAEVDRRWGVDGGQR